MIPEADLYLYAGVAFAVATLGFLAATTRLSGGTRRGFLPVVVACGLSTASYLAMWMGFGVVSPSGSPVYVTRFVEYGVTFPAFIGVTCLTVGAGRRGTGLAVAGSLTFVLGMLGAQLAGGAAAIGLFFLAVGGFLLVAWATFGPVWETARTATDERRLLFWKLRNLIVLLLGISLVLGLLTRQVLGVFDAFVGILLATYLDVLVRVGFGLLFLRGADAFEGSDTVRPPTRPDPLAESAARSDASAPTPPADD